MGLKPRGDRSSGYEGVAAEFLARRSASIGVRAVQAWASQLSPQASVLDLGCGSGVPITSALIERGLAVYAIDASSSLVAAFKGRFPGTPVACESVQESSFFGRPFDAALAWGLMFLLPASDQVALIHRVGQILPYGGRFLFTAPAQVCTWTDEMTGRDSRSLGAAEYRRQLAAAELIVVMEYEDEGQNHYYDAIKRPDP